MTTDISDLTSLIERAREIEREGITGPDWRSGERMYRPGYEAKSIAVLVRLADALEEAVRVIRVVAELTPSPSGRITSITTGDMRRARDWLARHATGQRKCETCSDTGEIDQRLGGAPTSGVVPCPDCTSQRKGGDDGE